jgi:raffinose/stachyose/melibiose transport system substrate-binding protein
MASPRWLQLVLLIPGLAASAGCRPASTADGVVLKVATTQQGERMREPFDAAIASFEQAHPGVQVDVTEMDDDVYQKMGLLTLFVGGTPPDVYFQWGGYLVGRYAAAGYALDLTAEFPPAARERYLPTVWASCRGRDGRLYLWPNSASVTLVVWYRRSLFRRLGVAPPADWAGFLAVCERLRGAGLIPLAVGNRELWPGANLAAALAARQAGAEHYARLFRLENGTRLDDPAFVAALERLRELADRGYLNTGPNGVSADDARSLLAQGKAGMLTSGDWLVSEVDEAESADLDCFLLPRLPEQAGDDSALLSLATGYMVYRRTPHPDLALSLLRHLGSPAVQRSWSRAGYMSALKAAGPGPDAPAGQLRLWRYLNTARETALAPDIGFNLEVSDAWQDAVSLVLGRRAPPAAALADAERQVAALRAAN